jgi:hypothetical protein
LVDLGFGIASESSEALAARRLLAIFRNGTRAPQANDSLDDSLSVQLGYPTCSTTSLIVLLWRPKARLIPQSLVLRSFKQQPQPKLEHEERHIAGIQHT